MPVHNAPRIVGIEHPVPVGETIGVEYQGRKGRFSVVWAGQAGTAEAGKIEIRPLDIVQNFWGIDFTQFGERYRSASGGLRHATLAEARFPYASHSSPGSVSAAVTDISLSGCYVELMETYPVGTRLSLLLNVESISIRFCGRSSHLSSRRRHGREIRRDERE